MYAGHFFCIYELSWLYRVIPCTNINIMFIKSMIYVKNDSLRAMENMLFCPKGHLQPNLKKFFEQVFARVIGDNFRKQQLIFARNG